MPEYSPLLFTLRSFEEWDRESTANNALFVEFVSTHLKLRNPAMDELMRSLVVRGQELFRTPDPRRQRVVSGYAHLGGLMMYRWCEFAHREQDFFAQSPFLPPLLTKERDAFLTEHCRVPTDIVKTNIDERAAVSHPDEFFFKHFFWDYIGKTSRAIGHNTEYPVLFTVYGVRDAVEVARERESRTVDVVV